MLLLTANDLFSTSKGCSQITIHSAAYLDVDENGLSYMMLCRVIMGNMELINTGSKQFQPTNDNFDSGVDDLQAPKHYVVWDMNAHTHICPHHIVAFKPPAKAKGSFYDVMGTFMSCLESLQL